MAAHFASLVRHLRQAGDRDLGDAVLLDRYIRQRDEGAFAALVERHGPMVFGLCRRALPRVQDAEDAFQATFLVLARRAPVVRPETLVPWLYGVARRVARRVLSQSATPSPPLDACDDPRSDPLARLT